MGHCGGVGQWGSFAEGIVAQQMQPLQMQKVQERVAVLIVAFRRGTVQTG